MGIVEHLYEVEGDNSGPVYTRPESLKTISFSVTPKQNIRVYTIVFISFFLFTRIRRSHRKRCGNLLGTYCACAQTSKSRGIDTVARSSCFHQCDQPADSSVLIVCASGARKQKSGGEEGLSKEKPDNFVWTDDEVQLLLKVTGEYKANKEMESID